jgi:hypothetical protein
LKYPALVRFDALRVLRPQTQEPYRRDPDTLREAVAALVADFNETTEPAERIRLHRSILEARARLAQAQHQSRSAP